MFRKIRGIHLPYYKQGLIYFTCRNYRELPLDKQEKINNLCMDVAGEYYPALRDILLTDKSIVRISMDSNLSESTLYRLRRKFYERW